MDSPCPLLLTHVCQQAESATFTNQQERGTDPKELWKINDRKTTQSLVGFCLASVFYSMLIEQQEAGGR
jgi:hypothetical protein